MMNIFTMYLGQGEPVVVRHAGEAVIIDASFAGGCEDNGKRNGTTLHRPLQDHKVPGLILTSFDTDHCDPDGVEFILSKFDPDWIMYPKYFKETDSATAVVLKLTGLGPSGFSYLITGDTENERWEQINRFYGGA
jgi:beta-lactamase superfamily II metal-dependent hydrolase